MIIFLDNSNLLDVASGIILHGCNAQGVMGSGVARQLRSKYPVVYEDYSRHCQARKISCGYVPLGEVVYSWVSPGLHVASGITQEYYGRESGRQYVDYSAIYSVVDRVLFTATRKPEKLDVHIPYMIGAGLGGGNLAEIKTIIEDISSHYSHNIYCHIYRGD